MNRHTFYIYSNIDFSQKSAGATRMTYYARTLATNIDKVYLASCSSNTISDINFTQIEPNIFVQTNVNLTKSLIGTFSFLEKINSFAKSKQGSSTFIFYPFPLVFLEVLSLLYLKWYKGRRLFCELNEVRKYSSSFHAPLSLKRIRYSIKKIIFITAFSIMPVFLYFYDGLICISTNIENYGKKYNNNTLRIPILTDPTLIHEKSDKQYTSKNSFNIGFSGLIAPTKENLGSFISILNSLRKQGYNISFNLCGMISDKYHDYLFNPDTVIQGIQYYGNLNKKELSTFLSQQDLLVIPRGFTQQNKYGFSTKLSDYLNHQKIILLTDISDNNLYIEDGINGFIVPPDQENPMRKKLIYIIDNYTELKKTIIPNSLTTSFNKFYFVNFRTLLRSFLIRETKTTSINNE